MKLLRDRRFQVVAVVIVTALLIVGIAINLMGGEKKTPSASVEEVGKIAAEKPEFEISVGDNGFRPQSATIKKGVVVVWRNRSNEAISINSDTHPDHKLHPDLNLGYVEVTAGSTQVFLNETGTYNYHNEFKPTQKGTIIVE